ncbi:prepilin-type N-terminal cleavage/methylation domain-containing protein [Halomonas sp. Bachu 37]|uniref:PilW family protein n=1 Tax=Halomonas kashgarensis TaxID=3084920 RepID=UPI0032171992
MSMHRQKGFTLVELMVAMVIGSIIILGAGSLFLTTFQTFQKVNELSRKQETVIFAANTLVDEYRKGEGEGRYKLEETKDSDGNTECSIFDKNSNSQPIVGGLAQYEGKCDKGRFISDVEVGDEKTLVGYHRFTLDFERNDDDEGVETLSFHVMSRNQALVSGSPILPAPPVSPKEQYKVGTGDVVIAGEGVGNIDNKKLQEKSTISGDLGSGKMPNPYIGNNSSPGYVNGLRNTMMDDVEDTCNSSEMAASKKTIIYCEGEHLKFNVDGMDNKIVIAETGVDINQNGNVSVNNLVVVARRAINFHGSNTGANFSGIIWSGEGVHLHADGVNFEGVVISGKDVTVNGKSNITSNWNMLDLLSVPGYEFSMYEKFKEMGILEHIQEADRN